MNEQEDLMKATAEFFRAAVAMFRMANQTEGKRAKYTNPKPFTIDIEGEQVSANEMYIAALYGATYLQGYVQKVRQKSSS